MDEACRAEILAGASVDFTPDRTNSVANLVVIYRRRVEHLRERGIRFAGDDLVDRLLSADCQDARIAAVAGGDNYFVFLASGQPVVIGTIGVDGAVANREFYGG